MIALLFISLLPLTEGHRATKTTKGVKETKRALKPEWPCSEAMVLLGRGDIRPLPCRRTREGSLRIVPTKKLIRKEGWGDVPQAEGEVQV